MDTEHSESVLFGTVRDYERYGKVLNIIFSWGNVIIGKELSGAADRVFGLTKIILIAFLVLLHN